MNPANCFTQNGRHGNDANLINHLLGRDRQAVCHNHLIHGRLLKPFDGWSAEDRVSGADIDSSGPVGLGDVGCTDNRTCRRDHIIEKERDLAFDRTSDQVGLMSFRRTGSAFVNNGQLAPQVLNVLKRALDAAFVRADDDDLFGLQMQRLEEFIKRPA